MQAGLRRLLSRIAAPFTRRRDESDFDCEIQQHLALLEERFRRQGMAPGEARYAARRQFGGIAQLKERRHESRGFAALEIFIQDTFQAIRALLKRPAFAATAVATSALGIGANTAVFTIVKAVLLRPLNAPHPDSIVRFLEVYGNTTGNTVGSAAYVQWRELTDTFEGVAAHRLEWMNLTGVEQPEQLPVARATASFFQLFGAPMFSGRPFNTEEDRSGSSRVAVISYSLWTRHSGGSAAAGTSILLGGVPYVITGVLAPGYNTEQFDPVPDAWIPFQIDPNPHQGDLLTVTGRLKPGVSLAAARERLKASDAESKASHPRDTSHTTVEPLRDAMVGGVRPALLLLAGAVGLVLLISCANVAGLLLIRASGRTREIAIRASIGAGRMRIVRQLLTESLVLSFAGGGLGLVLGMVGIRAILGLYTKSAFTTGLDTSISPFHIPRIGASASAAALDWRVAMCTIAVSLLTAVLFGLAPALQASRTDLNSALKSGISGANMRERKSRPILVVCETGLAVLLLIGAALLIRTYVALRSVNPGFDKRDVLVTQMSLAGTRFESPLALSRLVSDGRDRLRAIPGVSFAGAGCCIPLETTWQMPVIVEGRPLNGWFHAFGGYTLVSPGYFEVFRVPLIQGRLFNERDNAGSPNVVMINEALARQLWPHSNPLHDRVLIGKGMGPKYDHDTTREIIGVAGDIRDRGLNRAARPAVYIPIAQVPGSTAAATLELLPVAWFVRAPVGPRALSSSIQASLQQASGGLPITRLRSIDEVESQSTVRENFNMLLMSLFGGAALLLSAVGMYGLMGYSVQQRTPELGIRIALGASPSAIRRMFLLWGMRLTLFGVIAGLAAALGLTRLLSSFLFGVKPWDELVFMVAPAILVAVALVASWLPAARAMRADPLAALRS
jgi:predicted permease